ncbi:META domain-containing protein [Streptomyces sp. NPDC001985]|uniref:META domain-containing protein n=1 Tax=Streptomyces sp. NPDC001985 TaxID=3154406 RepID=UPI0033234F01
MRKELSVPLTVLALLAIAACGSESTTGKGSDSGGDGAGARTADLPLAGVDWSVDTLTTGGRKSTAPAGAHIEITEKGRAQGSLGCNPFSAKAEISGETLTLGAGDSTEMACAKDIQDFENKLRSALTGSLDARLEGKGKKLTLTTGSGDTITLVDAGTAPLIGTKWTVDSLLSGDVAESLPAGTERNAHLTFGKDGTVRGNLGCNSFNSTAKVSGSKITLGRISATRMMCAGTASMVEAHMLKVLDGEITYNLLNRGLTLTGPADKRVSAVAGR